MENKTYFSFKKVLGIKLESNYSISYLFFDIKSSFSYYYSAFSYLVFCGDLNLEDFLNTDLKGDLNPDFFKLLKGEPFKLKVRSKPVKPDKADKVFEFYL